MITLDEQNYLTIAELSKKTGIAPSTLYNWVSKGAIPHRTLINRVLIPEEALEQLLR